MSPTPERDDARSAAGEEGLPFPTSLCHRCAAPPRFVRGARSVFILCPVRPDRYPRQPVVECPYYRAAETSRTGASTSADPRPGP